MRKILPASFCSREHARFLPCMLEPPLALLVKDLRSEEAYDEDAIAEITALQVVGQMMKQHIGKAYALIAGQKFERVRSFRSRRGLKPQTIGLEGLEIRELEADNGGGFSRLGLAMSLQDFTYDRAPNVILNWLYGMLLLCNMNIEQVSTMAESWLLQNGDGPLGFDYGAVMSFLRAQRETAIVRYFPADNGHRDCIVVVGNKQFLEQEIEARLDTLEF